MLGIFFSILAGVLITVQGVFNTRLSDKIGQVEATVIVHLVGLITSLAVFSFIKGNSFSKITEVNKLYLLGGVMGVVIVLSVMKGISLLGPGFSISVLLITQLLAALIIDMFGLFGSPKVSFDFTKPLGVVIIILGILIFKFRG
ncbi:MAG: DMT family transporter [Clostridia bacterium]|nr:DMT family transporter [Clostridia bacterium]